MYNAGLHLGQTLYAYKPIYTEDQNVLYMAMLTQLNYLTAACAAQQLRRCAAAVYTTANAPTLLYKRRATSATVERALTNISNGLDYGYITQSEL